jgi:hypothetical protein
VALAIAGLAVVALLGTIATSSTTLVFAVVMLIAVLPLVNSRPVVWIALAFTITWTSRLLTVWGPLPRVVDFMDFPLVLVAFLFAGVRYLDSDRRLDKAQRRICRCVLLVSVVIALSWAFHNHDEPQRLVAGWVLALEPFLLLLAVLLAPMTDRERRMLLRLTLVLLCGQVLFSAAEFAAGGIDDDLKGTLLEAGAGHHVSAGGVAVGFFLLAKTGRSRLVVAGFGVVALADNILADAKQVLFVVPLALLVLGVTSVHRRSATSLVGGLIAGVLMAGVAVYGLATYAASGTAVDFIDRSTTNDTGKLAAANALWVDLQASPDDLLLGLGPGESVSRFAFLTTPGLFKEGSPVALLGLSESRGAAKYDAIAFSGPFTGKSSFTSAQSSAMGILGDYGLLGSLAFAALVLAVLAALRHASDRPLRSAASAAWALLLPLAVVFDWLEQPPFTLAVFLITGLVLRSEPKLPTPAAHRRPAT